MASCPLLLGNAVNWTGRDAFDRRVLFIFCGEFGRTPLIRNQDPSGRPGRDH